MIGDIEHNDIVTLFGKKFECKSVELKDGYMFAPKISIDGDGKIMLNSIDIVCNGN